MRKHLIRLPWPPSKLSANGSQGDYHGKAEAARKYKSDCVKEFWAQAVRPADFDKAHVDVMFCPPSLHRYDLDNALKKVKQGLDAVADAVGIDDADWLSMTLTRGDKVKGGSVLVMVSPADNGLTEIELRGVVK